MYVELDDGSFAFKKEDRLGYVGQKVGIALVHSPSTKRYRLLSHGQPEVVRRIAVEKQRFIQDQYVSIIGNCTRQEAHALSEMLTMVYYLELDSSQINCSTLNDLVYIQTSEMLSFFHDRYTRAESIKILDRFKKEKA